MKVTPDELLAFYRTYGFSIEITIAYELEELKRKQAAEVTEEAFDEFDPIRAHGMGVELGMAHVISLASAREVSPLPCSAPAVL